MQENKKRRRLGKLAVGCGCLLAMLLFCCVCLAGTVGAMTLKEAASQVRYLYLPATQVEKRYPATANSDGERMLKVKTEAVFLRLTPDGADASGNKMRLTGQKIPCSVTEGRVRDGAEVWKETKHVFLDLGDLQLELFFGNGSCLSALPRIWFWLYNEEEDLGYAFTLGKWKRDVLRSPNQDDYIEGEAPGFLDGGATIGSPQLGVSASGSNAQGGIYLPYQPRKIKPAVRIQGDQRVTLVKGRKQKLTATGLIAGDRILGWYSNNTAVVRVNRWSGSLVAGRKGSALVTVKTVKGAAASVRVIVKNPVVRVNKLSITLRAGKKYTALKAYGWLLGDSIKAWKSSRSRVVKVIRGAAGGCTLQAKKKGTAVLTVVTKLGAKAKVKVRIK